MAQFTFTGESQRVYPGLGPDGENLVVAPGAVYDLESAPDERFVTAGDTDKLARPDVTTELESAQNDEIAPVEAQADGDVNG